MIPVYVNGLPVYDPPSPPLTVAPNNTLLDPGGCGNFALIKTDSSSPRRPDLGSGNTPTPVSALPVSASQPFPAPGTAVGSTFVNCVPYRGHGLSLNARKELLACLRQDSDRNGGQSVVGAIRTPNGGMNMLPTMISHDDDGMDMDVDLDVDMSMNHDPPIYNPWALPSEEEDRLLGLPGNWNQDSSTPRDPPFVPSHIETPETAVEPVYNFSPCAAAVALDHDKKVVSDEQEIISENQFITKNEGKVTYEESVNHQDQKTEATNLSHEDEEFLLDAIDIYPSSLAELFECWDKELLLIGIRNLPASTEVDYDIKPKMEPGYEYPPVTVVGEDSHVYDIINPDIKCHESPLSCIPSEYGCIPMNLDSDPPAEPEELGQSFNAAANIDVKVPYDFGDEQDEYIDPNFQTGDSSQGATDFPITMDANNTSAMLASHLTNPGYGFASPPMQHSLSRGVDISRSSTVDPTLPTFNSTPFQEDPDFDFNTLLFNNCSRSVLPTSGLNLPVTPELIGFSPNDAALTPHSSRDSSQTASREFSPSETGDGRASGQEAQAQSNANTTNTTNKQFGTQKPTSESMGSYTPSGTTMISTPDSTSVVEEEAEDLQFDISESLKMPYSRLIYVALMESSINAMTLRELYEWFQNRTIKMGPDPKCRGWQNSIRHNLSMNAAFIKVPIDPDTPVEDVLPNHLSGDLRKPNMWALARWAIGNGVVSTTRYRKNSTKTRSHSMPPESGSDSASMTDVQEEESPMRQKEESRVRQEDSLVSEVQNEVSRSRDVLLCGLSFMAQDQQILQINDQTHEDPHVNPVQTHSLPHDQHTIPVPQCPTPSAIQRNPNTTPHRIYSRGIPIHRRRTSLPQVRTPLVDGRRQTQFYSPNRHAQSLQRAYQTPSLQSQLPLPTAVPAQHIENILSPPPLVSSGAGIARRGVDRLPSFAEMIDGVTARDCSRK